MTDLKTAARKLCEAVEFDMNGRDGRGGNGGLMSDATLRACHEVQAILNRLGVQELEQSTAVAAAKTVIDFNFYERPTARAGGPFGVMAYARGNGFRFEGGRAPRDALVGAISLMYGSGLWSVDEIVIICSRLAKDPTSLAEDAIKDHCRWTKPIEINARRVNL